MAVGETTVAKEIVLDALLMVWRRSPNQEVMIHSDQLSQYSSNEWNRFCIAHGFVPSMSRRGNCYDKAMESFFSSLKKEKICRHIFKTREEAKVQILQSIEELIIERDAINI